MCVCVNVKDDKSVKVQGLGRVSMNGVYVCVGAGLCGVHIMSVLPFSILDG